MNAPKISVVIPARNRAEVLAKCLGALAMSQPQPFEIIVVDDASTDGTSTVARQHGARVIRLESNHNANFCRNRGAGEAHGDILMFLDSDVVVQPATLQAVVGSFVNEHTDAVVGLYTTHHRYKTLASQYKNLWIRYSYLHSDPSVDWIFGAVSAIRREAFQQIGGFDTSLLALHGNDDLELGKRMANRQYHIQLNPSIEVEHLKQHTLWSLLDNDYRRSQGFVRLAGKLGQLRRSISHGFANIYPQFAYSILTAWVLLVSFLCGFIIPQAWWITAGATVLYLGLNARFLVYYARHRGVPETVAVLGIMLLDHLVCGVGALVGLTKWLLSR